MKRSLAFALAVLGIMIPSICPAVAQFSGDATFEKMLLDDLGITEEQLDSMAFAALPVFERFEQRTQELVGKILDTSELSLEHAEPNPDDMGLHLNVMNQIQLGKYEYLMLLHDEMTVAAQEILSDGQIQAFRERMFQVNFENWGTYFEFLEDGVIGKDYTDINLICGSLDVLNFTPEQKTEIFDVVSEANMETNRAIYEIDMEFHKEAQALRDQIAKAQTEEEKEPFRKKLNELNFEKNRKTDQISKKASEKINEKLDKILTDEQKAKKQKLFEQMPDYIWRARLENQDKERPWRPNIESWRPGQGAPKLDNHPGETRPEKKQEGKKSFPGSE